MTKLISTLLLLVVFAECQSQQAGDRITKTAVGIYNNSNTEKIILLGSNSRMDTFKLRANELWISGSYTYNPRFQIKTGTRVTTYQLRLDNYYMIYWNERKKYWDLKKTKRPDKVSASRYLTNGSNC